MRYNHLNPQHQYLIDKIEEQEKRIASLEEKNFLLKDWLEHYKETRREAYLQIAEFMSLSPLKKMFYKFKI